MNRRTFLASGVPVAVALAGCNVLSSDPEPISRTFQTTTAELEQPDHTESQAVTEDVFSTFVGTMLHDEGYENAGVWGEATERSNNAPEFLGALTEGLTYVGRDVTSTHTLAVYPLDDEGPRRRHQCWFWSGVDVAQIEEQLVEIEIEFNAQSDGVVIGADAPLGTIDGDQTDQYDLDLSYTIGDDGITASLPLSDGTVEVVREGTAMGPGGSVQTRWSGTIDDQYAYGMTCVAEGDTGADVDIDWRVGGRFA